MFSRYNSKSSLGDLVVHCNCVTHLHRKYLFWGLNRRPVLILSFWKKTKTNMNTYFEPVSSVFSCFDCSCTDIDECRLYSDLCENGQCTNTVGSYRCVCNHGYRPDSTASRCLGKYRSYRSASMNMVGDAGKLTKNCVLYGFAPITNCIHITWTHHS